MSLQQITIDDVLHQSFNELEHEGPGVYPKIDWLTLMFSDSSIYDVLVFLGQDEFLDDFVRSLYEKSGLYDQVVFVYNYIRIEVAKFYFYGNREEDVSMFDVVVPQIRVDLSGTALDYLRSCGWDFYQVRYLLDGSLTFHISRCDWAFDFIDYKAEFVDQLINHLQSHQLASGRVPLISTRGAVKYSLKLGSEKTVYLGATKSDKLLRVYDKKLQYSDPLTGAYTRPNPYNDPQSWFRIELQTRNYTAHGLLMRGEDGQIRDYEDILKYIFEQYAFADGTVDGNYHKRTPVEFWLKLFPWEEVRSKIIQNAKYVQCKSREERIKETFETTQIRNVILYIHTFGWERFCIVINNYLDKLSPSRDLVDPSAYKRRMAFFSMLTEIGKPVPDNSHIDSGLWYDGHKFRFIDPRG